MTNPTCWWKWTNGKPWIPCKNRVEFAVRTRGSQARHPCCGAHAAELDAVGQIDSAIRVDVADGAAVAR